MNDLPFKPGDKVMRVSEKSSVIGLSHSLPELLPYGRTFCVKDCYPTYAGPRMQLVGIELPFMSIGIICDNFRKVEEIRLCIEAVKKVTHPLFASDPNA